MFASLVNNQEGAALLFKANEDDGEIFGDRKFALVADGKQVAESDLVEQLVEYFRETGVRDWYFSSSMDFPDEYGVEIDVHDVCEQALKQVPSPAQYEATLADFRLVAHAVVTNATGGMLHNRALIALAALMDGAQKPSDEAASERVENIIGGV